MKRYPLFIICLFITATACNTKVKKVSEKEIAARADSIIKNSVPAIDSQAMDDLEKRVTIEVKAKADSIVAARKQPARPDTAAIRQNAGRAPEEALRFRQKKIENDTLR